MRFQARCGRCGTVGKYVADNDDTRRFVREKDLEIHCFCGQCRKRFILDRETADAIRAGMADVIADGAV